MEIKKLIPALLAGLALSSAAQATLVDNGGGLIYDTDLNITWLQNANLAHSNNFGMTGAGIDPNGGGFMTWDAAQAFITAMNAQNYLGHNDWRLPTMTDTGAPGCDAAYSGTDCGYNSNSGEMAHLFYSELGDTPDYDTSGNQTNFTGVQNSGPFINIQRGPTAAYWYGTQYAPDTVHGAWVFDFTGGGQLAYQKASGFYIWPVLPGDAFVGGGNPNNTNTVPEPQAWLMMLAGLGLVGVAAASRRRVEA